MKSRIYLLGLVLLLIVSAPGYGQTVSPANSENKKLAPAFDLTSLGGEKFELTALRGKIVVLNFWFTGCEPCIAEFPQLNKLVKKYKEKGVVFIAPSFDDVPTLKSFFKTHTFNYEIVPRAGGLILGPYSDGSGNVVFPTHIVIDREGRIVTRLTGSEGIAKLRKSIAGLVNGEAEKPK